jgi:dihydrodipicolinate synthase/N-acetylneuraminate lyase
LISAIFGAGGDFAKLTTSERIAIAEACVLALETPVAQPEDR